MNLEKFTDRARGFLQSAQTVAIRMSHQQITPEHLLKALLEDEQGMAAGLIKAAAFGFVVALMGTWCGYSSRGGAEGVGGATTSAVVSSSILILFLDYILTQAFFTR